MTATEEKSRKTQKGIKKPAKWFLFGTFSMYIVVTLLMFLKPPPDTFDFMIRWGALIGYASIFMATLLSNYLREVYKYLGQSFLKVHHYFAIVGIILVTAHPLFFSIKVMNPLVFVPDVSSWSAFWSLAGRPALYLIYVACIAAILRKKVKKYWKMIHALMYAALLFGLVHAIMIGTDFTNAEGAPMIILFCAMFTASVLVFINKRLLSRKRKMAKTRSD